ncbi:hypothetical protein EVAR_3698_1 [Eumeta japonica]|uniref:Uncharacterized protein n=1 Tax=Eumeta variegata TaxID=151549 RepID=A0A4C1SU37_EUMVA|nr:hypothetical protein EVAR_3698_1 [Eumeta japonica]
MFYYKQSSLTPFAIVSTTLRILTLCLSCCAYGSFGLPPLPVTRRPLFFSKGGRQSLSLKYRSRGGRAEGAGNKVAEGGEVTRGRPRGDGAGARCK